MSRVLAISAVLALCCLPALAGSFTIISSPDATYLAGTTYIDPSAIPDGTDVPSISDGMLTVTFSSAVNKRTAPGGGWGTWSAAPDSQRDPAGTLPVFYSNGATSLMMSLSVPVLTFGFEAEPNPFSPHDMTAIFYDASIVELGRITRSADGSSGARLFAASVDPIEFVDFSSDVDFAIGAFRYSNDIPEPSTWALMSGGILALGLLLRRRAA